VTRLFLRELRNQQRLYWRSREAAFFTFLLPIIFLVLLGSVYGDEDIDGISGSTYLLAGLIGYGVVATAFAGLAISLVLRRESGVLKRVRGTPLPTSIYLGAVIVSTLVVLAGLVVAQVLIGRFLLDADWPASPFSLAVVVLVGAVVFAALGLALTGLVRSAEGASAVVNAIYLPLVFISGVFFGVDSLPGFFQAIAEISPLTYLLRLLRDLFIEGGDLTDNGTDLAVLVAWGIVGVAVALRVFRWEPREG
jgi:ABC-2 type transport system permease protein